MPAYRRFVEERRSRPGRNTVEGNRAAIQDSYQSRRAALVDQGATFTTPAGARAAAAGMRSMSALMPHSLPSLHAPAAIAC